MLAARLEWIVLRVAMRISGWSPGGGPTSAFELIDVVRIGELGSQRVVEMSGMIPSAPASMKKFIDDLNWIVNTRISLANAPAGLEVRSQVDGPGQLWVPGDRAVPVTDIAVCGPFQGRRR
jgi:hypothetical protein